MTMASNEKHNQKKQNSDQNKNESIKHLLGTKSFLDEKRHQKIELKKKHVVDWRMRHRVTILFMTFLNNILIAKNRTRSSCIMYEYRCRSTRCC